jgi:hypothetical protein
MMPEWPKYVKKSGDDAGTLCHMESSMMMEIAQWAAMERRQNVWIDGSLRNADFYAKVFENIRRQYPHYKISIMYIFADEASIRRRIQIRAEKTGRNVPEHLIQASLGAMDKALNKLTPLCDFVARIDNSGAVPVLAAFETVCTKGSWSILKERFARNTIDEADFPRFMPPLPVAKLKQEDLESMQHIQASGALEGQLIVNLSVASFQNSSLRALLEVLSCKSMQRLLMPLPQQIASHIHEQITDSIDKVLPKSVKDVGMGASQRIQKLWTDCAGSAQASLSLATSHLSKVGEDVRSALTIPAGAEHYCWVFPFGNLPLNIQLQLGAEDWHDPLVQLLSNGGFCYCDKDGVVLSVSSVSLKRESTFLQFDVPDMLPRETVDKMIKKCCFHPVTVPYLRERGATKYCWVHAKEAFGRTNVGGSHGAFVYTMNGMQTALRFPAMSS